MLQPAHIRVEERAQVRHAVFQHRDPVDTHAPGESPDIVGIKTAMAQHVRMHHAAAEISAVVALAEAHFAWARASHWMSTSIDGSVNGKKDGRKRIFTFDLEERLAELLQHPLHVGDISRLVDHQTLDLMEHRRVGGVGILPVVCRE